LSPATASARLSGRVRVDGVTVPLEAVDATPSARRRSDAINTRIKDAAADSNALHRVHHQHPRYEITSQLTKVRRQRVHAALDLLEEVRDRLVVER